MGRLFGFIKNVFVKAAKLINFIRLLIVNVIFIAVILFFYFSVTTEETPIIVENNSTLLINFNGRLVEQKQPIDLSQALSKQLTASNPNTTQEYEVEQVINTIKHAQKDDNISALAINLTNLQPASLNQLTDIGEAISEFKDEGKSVSVYSDNYSQSQYYLASFADDITLAPNGMVALQGYAVNRLYFKDLLDSLLITPHIFKVGTYKSFVEPFTETSMSDYSKQANQHWLDQIWQSYIERVIANRDKNPLINIDSINPDLATLKKNLLNASGDASKYAKSVGLVDRLAYVDSFIENLKSPQQEQNKTSHIINYHFYSSTIPSRYQETGVNDQVAVIHGSGEIVSGYAQGVAISDKNFNKLIKQAINNKRIKAVVLRLDTPGGSAFASENIRQQVLALKTANKKVIVSMGSVTASGGYWIASAADKIIASPTTLTGSIGIFGMFATIDKSLNKIGVYQDGVSTNELANIGITQPLTPELAEIFQIGIESGYENFLSVVSEGRDMTKEEVDNVAQGRVWTGIDAIENGLVDGLGNLQDAIALAAQLAELDKFDTVSIQPEMTPKQLFVHRVLSASISYLPTGIIQQPALFSMFEKLQQQTDFMTRINDPKNQYIYCTVCQIQ
ncbi:signal peptide peptidase SppA [Psychromonas aquatilis]|uniref:Signal peptide peptidase SppA n=1 Tax=Psychromonas aquatilis TaxID=2005072 RepID=A0ABU9GMR3_9GAMM